MEKSTYFLDNPAVLESLFNNYLEHVFNATQLDDENAACEATIDGALEFIRCITEPEEGVVVPESMQLESLTERLVGPLAARDLIEVDILKEHEAPEVMLLILSVLAQEFLALVADCHEKQATQEVFDLRCTSFIDTWVRYFLGVENV